MLSIGLMSGTSMDGIDAALIETDGLVQIKELGDTSIAYDIDFSILLKAAEFAVRKNDGNLLHAKENFTAAIESFLLEEWSLQGDELIEKLASLSFYFHHNKKTLITFDQVIQRSTELHADAVFKLLKKTHYTAKQIDVIGYHGQTLFHKPEKGITLQLGDGQWLANKTGIRVVNDFRSNDVTAGGQGAPFAPLYHQALAIRDKKIPVAIVNLGGIANITIVTGEGYEDLIGFDTGPANGLIDRFVKQRTQGKEQIDLDGHYGLEGKVHHDIVKILYEKSIPLQEDFYKLIPPKSLDIGDLQLIPELKNLSLADGCATLAAFTADTITQSIHLVRNTIPKFWVLAGGGSHNPVIRRELTARLKMLIDTDLSIMTADEMGWNSTALEGQIFAYLAVRSLLKLPLSVPGSTRVSEPLTGGCVHIPAMKN